MKDFEYTAPHSVGEAVSLLAEKGSQARVLAGGTDILVQLRSGRQTVDRLVDVKNMVLPVFASLVCTTPGCSGASCQYRSSYGIQSLNLDFGQHITGITSFRLYIR